MRVRVFRGALMATAGMTFGMYGATFLMPLLWIKEGALTPADAGLALVPMALAFTLVSPLSGGIHRVVWASRDNGRRRGGDRLRPAGDQPDRARCLALGKRDRSGPCGARHGLGHRTAHGGGLCGGGRWISGPLLGHGAWGRCSAGRGGLGAGGHTRLEVADVTDNVPGPRRPGSRVPAT